MFFSLLYRLIIIIFKIEVQFYLERTYQVCMLHSNMSSGAVNFSLQKDSNKQLQIFLIGREMRQVLWTAFKYANSDKNTQY